MLNAYSKDDKIVTLLHLSRAEVEQLRDQPYFCPACKHPVRIKNGKVKLPHFSHYSHSACTIHSEGETLEHLTLKKMFTKWCERQSICYELEKYLPDLNQRPDLLIGNIALEIQCSPLSIQRLVERTKNYQKNGYIPIWICGKKIFSNHQVLSELAKSLCYYSDKIGFYLWAVDWEQEELSLHFHIEEDWKKRLYSSKKTWSFYRHSLKQIFDFPKESKVYIQREIKIGELIQNYYYELNKGLLVRDERIRVVQAALYNNHFHLLQLPNWFYYPGLRIFCCRGSDILLKVKIWKWVQFFDQNVIGHVALINVLAKELEESSELFYELPNVPMKSIQAICLNQLFIYLISCGHLTKVQNGWEVRAGNSDQSPISIKAWLQIIKNKRIITATPIRNVIR